MFLSSLRKLALVRRILSITWCSTTSCHQQHVEYCKYISHIPPNILQHRVFAQNAIKNIKNYINIIAWASQQGSIRSTHSCPKHKNKKDAIANGTCVSFCNQPKAQFGYLRRVTLVCRCLHLFCGCSGGIWLHQESLRHILASPGTIAINVTWIERGFNAGQMHRSMYPSIFKRLQPIARYWLEIATFSYPLAFNTPVRSGPWDNRGKYHTVGKIQCL